MIRRYARFVAFLLVAGLVTAFIWPRLGAAPAVLIGFDAGALVFLVSLISLFRGATAKTMRDRAQSNEPDIQWMLLLATGIVAVTITGVWTELSALSKASEAEKSGMIWLATGSLLLVWLFANALGAIHYAHRWYLRGTGKVDPRGLEFPGGDTSPDYWDFTYFAMVLSMTFQVSDVTITSKSMRRLALGHSFVAFLFNIGVIALSVSLATSALSG